MTIGINCIKRDGFSAEIRSWLYQKQIEASKLSGNNSQMEKYDNSESLKDESVVDYQTLSSGCSANVIENSERLHEWLKLEEIEYLHKIFLEKEKLSYPELREELEAVKIFFTDNEYNRLFLKINQNRDFKCDWNEFVSYLIFGFQEDDPSTQTESLKLPISSAPFVRKSEHRSVVCAISLIKNTSDLIPDDDEMEKMLKNDGESEEHKAIKSLAIDDTPENKGIWVTASKEGQIRFWTSQLEPLRSGISKSLHLQMPTWILCIQALSDVGILCTSSTERELRFHETMAPGFLLRILIRSMPFAVCCMSYSFHPKCKSKSRLILGDYGGNVRILEFSSFLRGPFQSKPGTALIELFWSDIMKDKLPSFKCQEYLNIHSELIQQVFFSLRLNSLYVAAEYRNTKKYRGRCPGLIMANGNHKTIFRIPLGVTTFCLDEKNNVVATGGPDTYIRVWDVYVSSEPSGILTGHNTGIVMIFIQPEEKQLYSMDYQKIIKVWDLNDHVQLQTYGDLVRLTPGEHNLCYYYHVYLRVLLVGGRKLVAINCNPRVRVDQTDGNTHAAPVSVVLYNRLFRNVVTCGLDSFIIVWDPWSGRRKIIIKNCHTKQLYGETIDIEITAACFDPLEQFLVTGARDGSLKVWNYNNAVCIRNMNIRPEHAVTAVIWVVGRILAVGWDQQVTEFNDIEGREYGDSKIWPKFHTDDITCADVKAGEGVATATYSGELIFWKLETGQPYRRYNVAMPKEFKELKYNKESDSRQNHIEESPSISNANVTRFVRRSVSETIREINKRASTFQISDRFNDKPNINDYEHFSRSKLSPGEVLPMSVQAVLFLQMRPMTKDHGSVLVALETGVIQVYSHHQRGGYLRHFNAIHKTGDCVMAMTTDRKNRYLFTGTAMGYIKIWHIQNYCIPEKEKVTLSMPMLRLQFIFLRHDKFMPRAKRAVRWQLEPMLVSAYKGHIKAINSITFINLSKILITGSHDCSCRLWSLGGRYLGTLGTPLPWKKLSPFGPVEELNIHYRMPPDIKKVASSTTMKVITGDQKEDLKFVLKDTSQHDIGTETDAEEETFHLYCKSLRDPILGKHFTVPGRTGMQQYIDVDIKALHIPVFTHLKIHETSSLERPSTPPTIRRLGRENYMEFYKPTISSMHAEQDVLEDDYIVKGDRKLIRKISIAFENQKE